MLSYMSFDWVLAIYNENSKHIIMFYIKLMIHCLAFILHLHITYSVLQGILMSLILYQYHAVLHFKPSILATGW